MAKVRFSSGLINCTNEKEVSISGKTVGEILEKLSDRYGDCFRDKIFENGKLRRFLNIYLNGEDIRFLKELETTVEDGDEILILPIVSGG